MRASETGEMQGSSGLIDPLIGGIASGLRASPVAEPQRALRPTGKNAGVPRPQRSVRCESASIEPILGGTTEYLIYYLVAEPLGRIAWT